MKHIHLQIALAALFICGAAHGQTTSRAADSTHLSMLNGTGKTSEREQWPVLRTSPCSEATRLYPS